MAAVVALANVAVQHPIEAFGLGDKLTWGALVYPLAFFVTDLTNRRFGPAAARRAVTAGFAVAVVLSIALASPRVAAASGAAFLFGQLLDVAVFARLRRQAWWRAPLIASLLGSALDTALFFSLAFAGVAAMLEPVALAGSVTVPLWVSLAIFDFGVKAVAAALLLAPYGALMSTIRPFDHGMTAR